MPRLRLGRVARDIAVLAALAHGVMFVDALPEYRRAARRLAAVEERLYTQFGVKLPPAKLIMDHLVVLAHLTAPTVDIVAKRLREAVEEYLRRAGDPLAVGGESVPDRIVGDLAEPVARAIDRYRGDYEALYRIAARVAVAAHLYATGRLEEYKQVVREVRALAGLPPAPEEAAGGRGQSAASGDAPERVEAGGETRVTPFAGLVHSEPGAKPVVRLEPRVSVEEVAREAARAALAIADAGAARRLLEEAEGSVYKSMGVSRPTSGGVYEALVELAEGRRRDVEERLGEALRGYLRKAGLREEAAEEAARMLAPAVRSLLEAVRGETRSEMHTRLYRAAIIATTVAHLLASGRAREAAAIARRMEALARTGYKRAGVETGRRAVAHAAA